MAKYENKKNIFFKQYNFLSVRNNEFLGDNKISAGFDFFVPTPNIFPEPKDYFAIRDNKILWNEIYNLVYNPYRCIEDFIRLQRINNNSNDLVKDTYDTIIENFSLSSSKGVTTNASIYAFHCIFRFINRRDSNGMIMLPNDSVIDKMISYLFNTYKDYTILASTNKFTNSVHFIISNVVANQELIDRFADYYAKYGKTPYNNTVEFTKNIDIRFIDIQNQLERFLYFKPKI